MDIGKLKMDSHAANELEILNRTVPDNLLVGMYDEIVKLVAAFNKTGQSGGSAPYTASALSNAVEKLCLQEPIAPLTGEDWEWFEHVDGEFQNARESAVFKKGDRPAYYLDAIVFKGEEEYDTFTGTVQGITSRQSVKKFPFTPKRFYIDVRREKYNPDIHGTEDECRVVSCGDGDYVYFIKDENQLKQVWEYYDKFKDIKSDE